MKLNYDELFFKLFYETKYNVKDFNIVSQTQMILVFVSSLMSLESFPKIVEVVGEELEIRHPDILKKGSRLSALKQIIKCFFN